MYSNTELKRTNGTVEVGSKYLLKNLPATNERNDVTIT